ncbi:MAG TPA: GNAT family N-acetyltransferase [Pyrinomonadaceae bacterium]|jgi:predicted GNAT superfamily acetyltransferase|nr:GNAT family N-acetyltransferase [Pyrinomonadaceae bacterium]
MDAEIQIRECVTLAELSACVDLQREVFALPDIEISPVRHLIVSKNAGGFILGAFADDQLVGFVLSVPAFVRDARAFYSHMTAVKKAFQGSGIGARLKWGQRSEALNRDVKFLKWTFEPWKARNAYFNLEKLGAVVSEYHPNFYGIDYTTYSTGGQPIGLASDRLFAEWHLDSEKVIKLASDGEFSETYGVAAEIAVTPDWEALVATDPKAAIAEQSRLKNAFEAAFESKLIGRGFVRDDENPRYLLYRK